MGLDMYLNAKKYIHKVDWQQIDRDGLDNAKPTDEWQKIVELANLQDIAVNDVYGAQVEVVAAYWRKANQIHKWFVDNVQRGEDNCAEYYVSIDALKELRNTCMHALSTQDPEVLPPQSGFFFGSTEIDEYYWQDIQGTVSKLNKILESADIEKISYYYSSSW